MNYHSWAWFGAVALGLVGDGEVAVSTMLLVLSFLQFSFQLFWSLLAWLTMLFQSLSAQFQKKSIGNATSLVYVWWSKNACGWHQTPLWYCCLNCVATLTKMKAICYRGESKCYFVGKLLLPCAKGIKVRFSWQKRFNCWCGYGRETQLRFLWTSMKWREKRGTQLEGTNFSPVPVDCCW